MIASLNLSPIFPQSVHDVITLYSAVGMPLKRFMEMPRETPCAYGSPYAFANSYGDGLADREHMLMEAPMANQKLLHNEN